MSTEPKVAVPRPGVADMSPMSAARSTSVSRSWSAGFSAGWVRNLLAPTSVILWVPRLTVLSTGGPVITVGSFTWYRVQIRDGLNTWPGPVAVPVGPVDDSDCEYVNR